MDQQAQQDQQPGQPLDAPFSPASAAEAAEPVNFADRKSINAEQMAMLFGLNQAFSRSLSLKLSAWLGASIRISMTAAERCLYQNLLETIAIESSHFGQCRFRSPDSRVLFALDLALVEPVVNLGLGGLTDITGTGAKRDITQIDIALVNILFSMICAEMNHMWITCKLVADFESEVPRANAARFFTHSENVLSFIYEVQIGNIQGTFQMAFATAVSDVVLREIDRHDSQRIQPPATREILERRLSEVVQPVTLRLPPFRVLASAITQLQPGQILKSNLARATPFRFAAPPGGPVWEATAVVVDSRVSARLERSCPSELPN
ncbi:hypothetical protein FTO74_11265 [Granulicella sp. WH15]|uniref:hypothetical protein n=1 Tax=Granulicella sp. WH15 TaxID=2602070 RepID=UPI0013675E11|nr:hypothetical protein [Granulicella sp. WH15]QHN03887.1 hypothetical protein FTO74_11265 [Granulicella sp. WH15]